MASKTDRMIGIIVWLIVILLVVVFSEGVLTRTKSLLTQALIYLGVFVAGWLLGRYTYGSKA